MMEFATFICGGCQREINCVEIPLSHLCYSCAERASTKASRVPKSKSKHANKQGRTWEAIDLDELIKK